MPAILAFVAFLLGLILNLLGHGFNWPLLFLGLALVALHLIWPWTPWARNPSTP